MAMIEQSITEIGADASSKSTSPFLSIYKHLNNMGASLRCPLCLYTLRETPILLPCIHAFCHECILTHFNSNSKNSKSCPVCKAAATKRSIRPSPHLKELVQGYKSTLKSFGLVPVVYDKTANIHMTQMVTSEESVDDGEVKEHLQVSRAWVKELQNCDCADDKELDWVKEHQNKVVQVNENIYLNQNPEIKAKVAAEKRTHDNATEGKEGGTVEFCLQEDEISPSKAKKPRNSLDSTPDSTIATDAKTKNKPKVLESSSPKGNPINNDLSLEGKHLCNENSCDSQKSSRAEETNKNSPPAPTIEKENQIEQTKVATKQSTKPNINEANIPNETMIDTTIDTTIKDRDNITNDDLNDTKSRKNEATSPKDAKSIQSYQPGTIVSVLPRMWPGSNKPGGVARITRSFPEINSYHVAYVLGGREKNVSGEFIRAVEGDQDEYLDPGKGIVKMENDGKSAIGKRRKRVTNVDVKGKKQRDVMQKDIKAKEESKKAKTDETRNKKVKNPRKKDKTFEKNGSPKKSKILSQSEPEINNENKSSPKMSKILSQSEPGKINENKNVSEISKILSQSEPERSLEETRAKIEKLYAEKIDDAVKSRVVHILMSSVTDYVVSLVDVLILEMKKLGVPVQVIKDIKPTKKPTLCITSTSHDSQTTSATRTLKTMRCALTCVPILTPLWLTSCLEKKTLLHPKENMYIQTLPTKGIIEGAESGVCKYVFHKKRLLENVNVLFCGKWAQGAKKSDVMTLLKECGAIPKTSLKNMSFEDPVILLCDDSDNSISPTLFKTIEKVLKGELKDSVSVVGGSWLFDCVSCGVILGGKEYAPKGKKARELWKMSL